MRRDALYIYIFLLSQPLISVCPASNKPIAEVTTVTLAEYDEIIKATTEAWDIFVDLTAPRRGEIVHQIGEALRDKKAQLGRLISLEMGKIVQEGEGMCFNFRLMS